MLLASDVNNGLRSQYGLSLIGSRGKTGNQLQTESEKIP